VKGLEKRLDWEETHITVVVSTTFPDVHLTI